jgi:hypothetical protein
MVWQMGSRIRRVFLIFNTKRLVVTDFALASTYLCQRFALVADYPLTLIATALCFRLCFPSAARTDRIVVTPPYDTDVGRKCWHLVLNPSTVAVRIVHSHNTGETL